MRVMHKGATPRKDANAFAIATFALPSTGVAVTSTMKCVSSICSTLLFFAFVFAVMKIFLESMIFCVWLGVSISFHPLVF